jgi:uncharacterized protein
MVASAIPGIGPIDGVGLAAFCERYRVRTLRVFGSAVRGTLLPESDLDILLEFQPGVDPGLLELGGMQQDLSDLFDREVDLKTPDMFSAENLRRIVDSSVVGYAEA